MTFGYSRDDVGKFLPSYLAQGILQNDPFEVSLIFIQVLGLHWKIDYTYLEKQKFPYSMEWRKIVTDLLTLGIPILLLAGS